MDVPGLQPLPGGMSGETWLSEVAGERTVVRIYAGRSAARGPGAAELDAAVLAWVGGLVPVPDVLEVRRGDPAQDVPALLVTSYLPGVLLEDLLPDLGEADLTRVGTTLGTLLGRLAHVALPRAGAFRDQTLAIEPFPAAYADLGSLVDARAGDLGWSDADLARLDAVARDGDALLDRVGRVCLVHSDLNPKNLLVDPETLAVTGVLDWEYAHAGSPYADLGNLLRFDRHPAYVDAVLAAREAFVPDPRPDALDLARAADLVALVDLAVRKAENPVAARAHDLLLAIARSGDLHAVSSA
ncbi:MAG: aminoglycoside phosphotransferase family protein [Nocardioidaceae bacterium]|nr:aminoglycoside phosphotransferase family protein [Nocardioidaceae bacterium]